MDIGALLSINTVDLLVIGFLGAMFILGFVQGTVRRLLGLGGAVFAFLFASNIKEPLGAFLGREWQQFPPQYGEMIGYYVMFLAAWLACTIVIQGTYQKAPLFQKYTFVDELIGGFLGVVQGVFLLLVLVLIGDTFFLLAFPIDDDEVEFIRTFWTAIDSSATGALLHDTVIPRFVAILGFLVPESVRALYGSV